MRNTLTPAEAKALDKAEADAYAAVRAKAKAEAKAAAKAEAEAEAEFRAKAKARAAAPSAHNRPLTKLDRHNEERRLWLLDDDSFRLIAETTVDHQSEMLHARKQGALLAAADAAQATLKI